MQYLMYDKGKVTINIPEESTLKRVPNKRELFTIICNFARMFNDIITNSIDDSNNRSEFLKAYSDMFNLNYLSMMAGITPKEFYDFTTENITEDNTIFVIDESDWNVFIAGDLENITIKNAINTIVYTMMKLSNELYGDIDYVMKGTEIVDIMKNGEYDK